MIRLLLAQKFSLFKSVVFNGHRYPFALLIILLAMIIPVAVVIAQTIHPVSSQPDNRTLTRQSGLHQPVRTNGQQPGEDAADRADDQDRADGQFSDGGEDLGSPFIVTPATVQAPHTLTELVALIDTHKKADSIVTIAVQPEQTIAKYFLVTSENKASAQAFNCYFSFYFDGTILAPRTDSWPILIVDRLFFEQSRARVTQDLLFSDPEIVDDLAQWIGQLIDPNQSAAIVAFILDCYRQDYRQRLAPVDPGDDNQAVVAAVWQKSRQFGHLEVTYHADREIYCTFRLV